MHPYKIQLFRDSSLTKSLLKGQEGIIHNAPLQNSSGNRIITINISLMARSKDGNCNASDTLKYYQCHYVDPYIKPPLRVQEKVRA